MLICKYNTYRNGKKYSMYLSDLFLINNLAYFVSKMMAHSYLQNTLLGT